MTQIEWTRETALAVLEECERTASIPWTRKAWDAAHQQPSSDVLRQLFGSWTEAWRAAGDEVPTGNKSQPSCGTWDAKRILQGLRDHARSDDPIVETIAADAIEVLPIARLGLSVRAYHCLRNAHIETVGDLRCIEPKNLIKIPHFGQKCLQEICQILTMLNRSFPDSVMTATPPSPIDTWPVSSASFAGRINHGLADAGITTLGTLRRTSDAELLAIPNFGYDRLQQVRTVLQRLEAKATDLEHLVFSSYE